MCANMCTAKGFDFERDRVREEETASPVNMRSQLSCGLAVLHHT